MDQKVAKKPRSIVLLVLPTFLKVSAMSLPELVFDCHRKNDDVFCDSFNSLMRESNNVWAIFFYFLLFLWKCSLFYGQKLTLAFSQELRFIRIF